MFGRLNQTLDGLFKVASSSLSFALLYHDLVTKNIRTIRRRRDIVFSQVVSIVVVDSASCTSRCDKLVFSEVNQY